MYGTGVLCPKRLEQLSIFRREKNGSALWHGFIKMRM